MKIKGVPEGYELVGFVNVEYKDNYIDEAGGVETWENADPSDEILAKIVKIKPVCTWQHGMFKDGWIAQDEDESIYWYPVEPHLDPKSTNWRVNGHYCCLMDVAFILPVFREDLPWDKRIQKVGPEIESELKEDLSE